MGKLFKIIFTILTVIIVLVFVGVIALGIGLSDKTKVGSIEGGTLDAKEVVTNTIVEGTSDASTTKEADIYFTEEEIKALIISLIPKDLGGFELTGVNVSLEKDNYLVQVGGKLLFYPTVVSAYFSIEEKDGAFTVQISKAKIGKISFSSGLGKFVLSFMKIKDLEKSLEKDGVYLSIDEKNLSVTMTKENLLKTLDGLMDQSDAALIHLLGDVMLGNPTLAEFDFDSSDKLGVQLHLKAMEFNSEEEGITLPYTYDFDTIKTKVSTLLENNAISINEVSDAFNYLVKGYNALESDEKSWVEKKDFSSVGITNKKEYEGIIVKENKPLSDYFLTTQLGLFDLSNGLNLPISDDALTQTLKNLSFIGTSFAFCHSVTKEITYLVIEQLNVNVTKNQCQLDIIFNLQGVKLAATLVIQGEKNSGLQIQGQIEKVKIGSNEFTEAQISSLLTYLTSEVKDINWITMNKENKTITFDFSSLISNGNPAFAILLNRSSETSFEDGYVNIHFN